MTCCRRSWRAATGCSARRSATARSSTTSSIRAPTCRRAGPTTRRAAPTGCVRREDRGPVRVCRRPRSWKQFLWPPRVRLWRAQRPRATASRSSRGAERAVAGRLHRRALVRPARDRVPRQRAARHPESGPGLRSPARERVHRRAQLLAGRRHVLLRLDGHGPARARRATTWRSPRCSRTGATTSWSRRAATPARRSSPSCRCATPSEDGAGGGRAGDRAGRRGPGPRRWTRPTSRDLLYRNYEHPRWDEVADRCLTCGNCTMVCPTCFCTSVEDVTDLTGTDGGAVREWDSCFTMDFSYVHGGSVRSTPRSRYRQWMTHKLATWGDQFDTFGCVGLRALHHVVPGRDRHHRGGGRDPGDRRGRSARIRPGKWRQAREGER